MSKQHKGEYLEKKDDNTDGIKEQMLYGNGETLQEKDKKKKEYKKNTLNE